jgi:carbon storage regulator CsrA
MLVISRKLQESFMIFDPAGVPVGVIKLVDLRGDKARLGIEAPTAYKILRNELIDPPTNGDDTPSEAA